MLYNADGQMLPADHNSGIFQTDDWIENELYFQNENRVQDYVVRYKPDPVMIIAISHGHQSEPIRSVIRQIHEQCDAEILLTTAPIAQDKLVVENYAKDHEITIEEAAAIRKAFLEAAT